MSPLFVAIVFALICLGAFMLGLHLYRMAEPPSGTTVEQTRRFGRLLMMASTGLLLFLAAAIVHGNLRLIPPGKVVR